MENGLCVKYRKILRKAGRGDVRGPPGTDGAWEDRSSHRNHQHHHLNGHCPCPHLTLLLQCLRCIPRPAPSCRKTPARFVLVLVAIILIETDANRHIHNDPSSTRWPTPHLHPNPNPNPLSTAPGRNRPDRDTRPSRPKIGQWPHHWFQHRNRRPRASLRGSGLDALPTLQTEEATTSRLAECGPTAANQPPPLEYHQTILR